MPTVGRSRHRGPPTETRSTYCPWTWGGSGAPVKYDIVTAGSSYRTARGDPRLKVKHPIELSVLLLPAVDTLSLIWLANTHWPALWMNTLTWVLVGGPQSRALSVAPTAYPAQKRSVRDCSLISIAVDRS